MKKGNLIVFLLLLISPVAVSEIYKWVDESGKIHYGDEPPQESGAQSVTMPEGPSQQDIERAKQQSQEKMEQYKALFEKTTAVKPPAPIPPAPIPQEAHSPAMTADNLSCFSSLADLLQGTSSRALTSMIPTPLGKDRQELLDDLFAELDIRGRWRGTVTHRECHGSLAEPEPALTTSAAEINADWDMFRFRLMLSGIGRFEVGHFLYFSDVGVSNIMALDGNIVQILSLNPHEVSFLITRHIQTAAGTWRHRVEIRQLEIAGRNFRLIELYYHNEMLTGSATWTLGR